MPALWRELVKPRLRRSEAAAGIARQLALLPTGERRPSASSRFCTEEAAQILGLRSAAEAPVDQELKHLGLDSLIAVELRNRLSERLGMKLPATFSFDYPSVDSMASQLVERLSSEAEGVTSEQQLLAAVGRADPETSLSHLRELGVLQALFRLASIPLPTNGKQRDEKLDGFVESLDELDERGLANLLDDAIENLSGK